MIAKKIKEEWKKGEVPGTLYKESSNGWIDSAIFEDWFTNHFLSHASAERPLLLLLDGHSSHFTLPVIKRAAEEDVIIFCLPPHTTHLLQPLDRGCFGCLKAHWSAECNRFTTETFGQLVNRSNFVQLFGQSWRLAMTMTNVEASFRTTGIYPFNSKAVRLPGEAEQAQTPPTRKAFLPILTPLPLLTPLHHRRQLESPIANYCQFESPIASRYEFESPIACSPSDRGGIECPPFNLPEPVSAQNFREEETARFKKWQLEGYDLPNERYEKWLNSVKDLSMPASPVLPKTSLKSKWVLKPRLVNERKIFPKKVLSHASAKPLSKPPAVPALPALHCLPALPNPKDSRSFPTAKIMTSKANIRKVEEKTQKKRMRSKRRQRGRQ